MRAAVNIALFIIILPVIFTSALSRLGSGSRDLLVAKGSVVFLTVGALVLFLSAAPAVMIVGTYHAQLRSGIFHNYSLTDRYRRGLILLTLGMGFPPIARSLATSLVESKHADGSSDIGRLYSLISVMEGIGSLVAAPGMALAFRWGISLGDEWLGAPFGLAALLFAFVSVIVFRIKV